MNCIPAAYVCCSSVPFSEVFIFLTFLGILFPACFVWNWQLLKFEKKILLSCSITMPPSDISDDPARQGSSSTVRRSFFPLHPYCGKLYSLSWINQAFVLISKNTCRHHFLVTSSVKTVKKYANVYKTLHLCSGLMLQKIKNTCLCLYHSLNLMQ